MVKNSTGFDNAELLTTYIGYAQDLIPKASVADRKVLDECISAMCDIQGRFIDGLVEAIEQSEGRGFYENSLHDLLEFKSKELPLSNVVDYVCKGIKCWFHGMNYFPLEAGRSLLESSRKYFLAAKTVMQTRSQINGLIRNAREELSKQEDSNKPFLDIEMQLATDEEYLRNVFEHNLGITDPILLDEMSKNPAAIYFHRILEIKEKYDCQK